MRFAWFHGEINAGAVESHVFSIGVPVFYFTLRYNFRIPYHRVARSISGSALILFPPFLKTENNIITVLSRLLHREIWRSGDIIFSKTSNNPKF